MIEILTTGGANSVQDMGRPLYLDQGIGRGGAMDRPALQIANLMVGNAPDAAGLEITQFPFRLRFRDACWFALTGAICAASLNGRSLPPWWACRAEAGDELRISPPSLGARAMIAFAGGIDVPLVLGSAATDLKSGFGGLDGRGLDRGARLQIHSGGGRNSKSPDGFGIEPGMIRQIAGASATKVPLVVRFTFGAEYDAFSQQSRDNLVTHHWQVSRQANRQGCLLEGPTLALTKRLELFSHGIMPGTIQVPPSGQAIIQLAEANTCGGYPKIAHVIEPDLWKLAQAPPGSRLSLFPVTRQEAIEAMHIESAGLKSMAHQIARIIQPAKDTVAA